MCSHTKACHGTTPSIAEPAAPIGAMCLKEEGFLAPFSGISLFSAVVVLVVAFPVEGAEGQD